MRIWHWLLAGVVLHAAATSPSAAADPAETSLEPLPAKQWDRAAAAHLLRRAGFGGTPAEIDKLVALGPVEAVNYLVDYDRIEYQNAPPAIDPLAADGYDRRDLRTMTQEERRNAVEQQRRAQRRTLEEVRLWWIDRLVHSPRPFEEKLTLFWHGHFTSGAREVRNAIYLREQNEFLRKYALRNFRDLLIGISRDRAMLVYLDGNRNSRRQPNENYARELLELFTLGVGNFTEADVKAAARAFTGWGFNDNGFTFRKRDHDDGKKSFLGRTGNLDGADIIDIVLEQPACSKFLARTILEHFCRPDADRKLVDQLAAVIRKHNFELRPVFKTLFLSTAFYAPAARGSLVKSPVDLLAGSARQFGVAIEDLVAAERAMAMMGQELFQPPNVKGWDGGAKWINTATLFNRYNVVGGLIFGGNAATDRQRRARMRAAFGDDGPTMTAEAPMSTMNDEEGGGMEPRSRIISGQQPAYDALAAVRAEQLKTAAEIVDYLAAHLLATPLSAAKRDLLIQYLAGDDGQFDAAERAAAERVRAVVHLICSTPEYQMQ
jgi:uncharacterized protein (DUF1800 family)